MVSGDIPGNDPAIERLPLLHKAATHIFLVIGSNKIIELPEEAFKANSSLTDLKNATEIVYDKKDTKEIAGFKCYKATITMNDDSKSVFYVTEAITPPAGTSNSKVKLSGYPLEITVQTPQGEMIMKATKFVKETPADAFKVGEGFTKVTMEEFQKQMGGM